MWSQLASSMVSMRPSCQFCSAAGFRFYLREGVEKAENCVPPLAILPLVSPLGRLRYNDAVP